MYFSDERQSSSWTQFLGGYKFNTATNTFDTSTEILAVQSAVQSDKPGMITIAQLPSGTFMAAFEVCGPTYSCNAHLKTSTDGLNWGSMTDIGTAPLTNDGLSLRGNPFLAWCPAGGTNGELLFSAENFLTNGCCVTSSQRILVNSDPNFSSTAWRWVPEPYNSTHRYSSDLLPSLDGSLVRVMNGDGGNTRAISLMV